MGPSDLIMFLECCAAHTTTLMTCLLAANRCLSYVAFFFHDCVKVLRGCIHNLKCIKAKLGALQL